MLKNFWRERQMIILGALMLIFFLQTERSKILIR